MTLFGVRMLNPVQSDSIRRENLILMAVFFITVFVSGWVFPGYAQAETGLGELERLIQLHRPQEASESEEQLKGFEMPASLFPDSKPTLFSIPGFETYGCGECHQAENLVDMAVKRMRAAVILLKKGFPFVTDVPLKQYIIQPFANELLQGRQFAHATFDTIRLFPHTIIIDSKVYNQATQLHEVLHLTQPFLGHANELEAYSLNARMDPRFLLFNYRYFENVVSGFFIEDFKITLNRFFARDLKESTQLPKEVQWFMMPFDQEALNKISNAVVRMEPVFQEAFRIHRKFPLFSAYWSDRTGIHGLILDIAATRILSLPELSSPPEVQKQAFEILEQQFFKTDNIRLGYIIDRKNEALMALRYKFKITDSKERLGLYFHFLKKIFFDKDGEIKNFKDDSADFRNYIQEKLNGIQRMIRYEGISTIERASGEEFLKKVRN